jgi:hypothetical protein
MEPQRRVSEGCWDSIHVIEVTPKNGAKNGKGQHQYKITTTVILTMMTDKGEAGNINLSGNLTRQGRERTATTASDDTTWKVYPRGGASMTDQDESKTDDEAGNQGL